MSLLSSCKPQPATEHIYYKTVTVVITNISVVRFKIDTSYNVSVKNNEYSLTVTINVDRYSNNKLYNKIKNGTIKTGVKLNMKMYSVVNAKTGRVVSRYLDNRFIK